MVDYRFGECRWRSEPDVAGPVDDVENGEGGRKDAARVRVDDVDVFDARQRGSKLAARALLLRSGAAPLRSLRPTVSSSFVNATRIQ